MPAYVVSSPGSFFAPFAGLSLLPLSEADSSPLPSAAVERAPCSLTFSFTISRLYFCACLWSLKFISLLALLPDETGTLEECPGTTPTSHVALLQDVVPRWFETLSHLHQCRVFRLLRLTCMFAGESAPSTSPAPVFSSGFSVFPDERQGPSLPES